MIAIKKKKYIFSKPHKKKIFNTGINKYICELFDILYRKIMLFESIVERAIYISHMNIKPV